MKELTLSKLDEECIWKLYVIAQRATSLQVGQVRAIQDIVEDARRTIELVDSRAMRDV